MKPVAVLGGTFDPVHLGHLAVAEQICDQLDCAEAWMIPSRQPPHRGDAGASPEDRLDMLRVAVAPHPRLRVLDLELRRAGPSYTIDTLEELAATDPEREHWFVLGGDAAREIGIWHERERVLEQGRFAIVNRTGVPEMSADEARALGFPPERTRILHIDSPRISASSVRRRARSGQPLDGLVPAAVAAIISARGLYRER